MRDDVRKGFAYNRCSKLVAIIFSGREAEIPSRGKRKAAISQSVFGGEQTSIKSGWIVSPKLRSAYSAAIGPVPEAACICPAQLGNLHQKQQGAG